MAFGASNFMNPDTLLSACPSCGAKNRIPAGRLADTGRCGACKSSLPPARQPIEVDEPTFNAIVAASKVPVLVDFWAAWCGPCRAAAPEVERLAQEAAGQALVLKVDIDANPALAHRFGIQSIPNFMVFRANQPVFQRAGAAPRSEMRRWLDTAASSAAQA